MKRILCLAAAAFLLLQTYAQSSLVINGGSIQLNNGVYLIVNNNQPAGITVLNTSNGITNDATSFVRWNIGTNASTYTVPFYLNANYIPLSFTTSGAVGNGYFDLGSYHVPTWKNSDYLPTGVSNVNRNSTDNSNHVIDRFWSIAANGYTTKPMLSNLVFSYRDAEWNAPGNSINENLLMAQRWNNTLSKWSDYAPAGTVNTTANTVTIASVSPSNIFQWWTLVDASSPLPLQLLSFTAHLQNGIVKLDWITTSEVNTKEFVVERSSDHNLFVPIDTVAAAGNSSERRNYSTIDNSPLHGVSFYRLKMLDNDGHFNYSPVVLITNAGINAITVFPNPAKDKININSGNSKLYSIILADVTGKTIRRQEVSSPGIQLDVSTLPNGTYLLKIFTDRGTENLKILKQ